MSASIRTLRAMTLAMTLLSASNALGQSTTPFVPANFEVPEVLETEEFRLRMLTVNDRLCAAVQDWLAKEWPFTRVAYPGRSIDWEAWQAIPDEKR